MSEVTVENLGNVSPEIQAEQVEASEDTNIKAVEVGALFEGEIIKIKPFGAIVLLPDRSQGLVHISHISSKFVQNIEDFVNIGDVVNVKVISIDKASGRISLSMKEIEQNLAPRPQYQQRVTAQPYVHRDSNYSNDSSSATFEDKFKDWVRASNERQAGLNKRNKRR